MDGLKVSQDKMNATQDEILTMSTCQHPVLRALHNGPEKVSWTVYDLFTPVAMMHRTLPRAV